MSASVKINMRFTLFVDRPYVMSRIEEWKLKILGRVGAYGRGVVKRQFRPQKKGKKFNTVTFWPTSRELHENGRWTPTKNMVCHVPADGGPVIDVETGQPVNRFAARRARLELAGKRARDGVGKPPRRGPTDKLRKFTDFGVDPTNESVVAGSWPFPTQPDLVGAVSVPQLLDQGGYERIGSQLVKYEPRPFVERSLPPTQKFMEKIIEQRPIGGRGTFGVAT